VFVKKIDNDVDNLVRFLKNKKSLGTAVRQPAICQDLVISAETSYWLVQDPKLRDEDWTIKRRSEQFFGVGDDFVPRFHQSLAISEAMKREQVPNISGPLHTECFVESMAIASRRVDQAVLQKLVRRRSIFYFMNHLHSKKIASTYPEELKSI